MTNAAPRPLSEAVHVDTHHQDDMVATAGAEGPVQPRDSARIQTEASYLRRMDGGSTRVVLRRALHGLTRRTRLRAVQEVHPRLSQDGSRGEPWYETVQRDGVCAIPGFLSRERCAVLRAEIERLMRDYPAAVGRISRGSDARIFGAERGSTPIRDYTEDGALDQICQLWLGPGSSLFCVMANRLVEKPGNLGSGGQTWHRDSMVNQIKTIVYLNDVAEENGPYQYIRGSHRTAALLRDSRAMGVPVASSRYTDADVDRLTAMDPERLMTMAGRAGTLIVTDTTGIHRGSPIQAGVRYALTTYTFPRSRTRTASDSMLSHYKPILGIHVPLHEGSRPRELVA